MITYDHTALQEKCTIELFIRSRKAEGTFQKIKAPSACTVFCPYLDLFQLHNAPSKCTLMKNQNGTVFRSPCSAFSHSSQKDMVLPHKYFRHLSTVDMYLALHQARLQPLQITPWTTYTPCRCATRYQHPTGTLYQSQLTNSSQLLFNCPSANF